MKKLKLLLSCLMLGLLTNTLSAQTTQTFSNFDNITIPSSGTATPYPSTINVTGMTGIIIDINVVLYGVGHTWPDDIDIVLVSPTGQAVTLMSDCGGSTDINNLTITFDDDAGLNLPDETAITSGIYRATDFGTPPDNYPAPGPGSVSPPTLLSTFNGFDANGIWSLYVVDDVSSDLGAIANGWDLIVTTTGCILPLPIGAPETETCGADLNGGCNMVTPAFQDITCGETVTGTSWYDGSTRDTDWYRFTITSATNVTITASAEFDFLLFFVDISGGCGSATIIGSGASGAACTVASTTENLPPGTYVAFIAPQFTTPTFTCINNNDYYLTLTMDPVTPVISSSGLTTFCEGGSVMLSSSQATSYLWSPGGETTQSITVTSSGSYTVAATINGCPATTSAPVVVTVNPSTNVNYSGLTSPVCEEDDWQILTPTLYGGVFSGPGIIYDGAGYATTLSGPLAITDNLPAGTDYTFAPSGLPGTSLGNDYFLGSICLQIAHTWVGDLRATLTSPNGTTVVLFDRPGVPNTTFGCSGNDINVTIIPGTGTEMETVCNPGVPTISGTFNAFGGADLNSLNDGSDPNGVWILNVSDNAGGDVGSVTSLILNFGDIGIFDPFTAGTGTHTIEYDFYNCAGCLGTTSQNVTVNPLPAIPTVTPDGPTTFCEGGSVTLTSSSADSYLWSPGGATTQAVSVTSMGNYTVTVTNSFNCSRTSSGTPVIVNPLAPTPSFSGLAGPYCPSSSSPVNLTPSPRGGTFSGPGIVDDGDAASAALSGTPVSIPDNNPAGVNSIVTPSGVAGTVLGTDQFLTSVCLKITHTFVGDLKATLTSPNGTTVVLFDRPGTTGIGFGCSGNDIDVTIIPGTGTEMETVCNVGLNPTILGYFNAFNGADLNTLNDGSNPNGTWTLNVSDNAGGDVGTIISFTLNFGRNGSFNPNAAGPGTHTITYSQSPCNGCPPSVTTQTVTVNDPSATITAGGSTTFCEGGSVTLTANSGASYMWSPGGETTQSISVSSTGTHTVSVTDGDGCSAVSNPTTVTVNPNPTASFTYTQNDPTVDFSGSASGGSPGYAYSWDFGDGNNATGQIVSHTYNAPGSYDVELCVTDDESCTDCETQTVVILTIGINDKITSSISVFPNPASDVLFISAGNTAVEAVNIYDVNGKLVSSNIQPLNNTIDISAVAKGVYMAEILVNEKTHRVRWVKM